MSEGQKATKLPGPKKYDKFSDYQWALSIQFDSFCVIMATYVVLDC